MGKFMTTKINANTGTYRINTYDQGVGDPLTGIAQLVRDL